jgi:hypothetical protein
VPQDETALERLRIQSGGLGVVVPHDHPLASRKSVALAELSNEYFVVVPHSSVSPGYGPLHSLCQKAGFEPRIVQEVGSISSQLNLVSVGMGIGLTVTGKNFTYPASLAVVPLKDVNYTTTFALSWVKAALNRCASGWSTSSRNSHNEETHVSQARPARRAGAAADRSLRAGHAAAAAGGALHRRRHHDALARLLQVSLAEVLKRTVIVDNKPGAAGTIGTDFVARAAPDGNTIVFGNQAPNAIVPAVRKTPYDPLTDLRPLTTVAFMPLVLTVQAEAGRRP